MSCERDDCRAWRQGGNNCNALVDTKFKKSCPFYKTKEQYKEEVKRIKSRLNNDLFIQEIREERARKDGIK